MRYRLEWFSLAFVAVFASCVKTAMRVGLSEQDLFAVRSIASKDSALVMNRNWDALAAEYASDAVRMPPNQPAVMGRDAIRRWLNQLPPIANFSFHLDDVEGDGSIAYLRGSYNITVAPSGMKPITDSGKELIVLKRQRDGSWLRQVDAWNSNLPPG